MTQLAFEWLILTATRSGETRLARWNEIDEELALWTIPTDRMKAKRPHIVPLAPRCLEILIQIRDVLSGGDLVFPGTKAGEPLSDMTLTKVLRDMGLADHATVHGMRSAFKIWCAEVAKVRDEVSEAALAHTIVEKVRAAYLRTDFLEDRKALMAAWLNTAYPSQSPLLVTSRRQPAYSALDPLGHPRIQVHPDIARCKMKFPTYVPTAVRVHISKLLPILTSVINCPREQVITSIIRPYFEEQNKTGDYYERRFSSYLDEHLATIIDKCHRSQDLTPHKDFLIPFFAR